MPLQSKLLSLPTDTKVMVSEDGVLWLRRYLHHTERSMVDRSQINATVFPMGCDSWTFKNFDGKGMNPRLTVWAKWRLAEEGE